MDPKESENEGEIKDEAAAAAEEAEKPKAKAPKPKSPPKIKSDGMITEDPYDPAPVITQPTVHDKYSNQPMNPRVMSGQSLQRDYSPDPMRKPMSVAPTSLKEIPKSKILSGLDILSDLDYLFIKQKVNILEAITGFEQNNKYVIKSRAGEDLFFAVEDTDCGTRICCSNYRPFDIKILDIQTQKEVIHIHRELRCDSCLCPCFLQKLSVESPPGKLIGRVDQKWGLCLPKFHVNNPSGETVLQIEGPFCQMSCFKGANFKVLSKTGDTEVGKISKHWSGLAREFFTDADNFGIQFPLDLHEEVKAVLIGAAFLIDFMYFEDKH